MKLKYITTLNTFYKLQWNVHNRLLEFDVKSVIRKGNDGIFCSSYILCTLTMKFNEWDLKVLILSDQLLPGKNLISLDAFKAVLSLFIHDRPWIGGEILVFTHNTLRLVFTY